MSLQFVIRKYVWSAVAIVVYLVAIYLIYAGPLNHVMLAMGDYPVFNDLLWNYGVLFLFVLLLWALTRFVPKREMPKLAATWSKMVIFIFVLALDTMTLVFLWNWVFIHPLPEVANFLKFASGITKNLNFSPLTQATVLNAVAVVWITAILVAFVLWQFRGWRRQLFSITWREGAVTIALLAFSTILCTLKNVILNKPSTLFPTIGIFNVIIIFIAQFLVNGLQEEAFFRGYVFIQLLAWLRKPWIACWLMVLLFNATHIPSLIIGHGYHLEWWEWILFSAFPFQPTGWLFGVIFYRMRTTLPGAIFHTYITLWAFPFV